MAVTVSIEMMISKSLLTDVDEVFEKVLKNGNISRAINLNFFTRKGNGFSLPFLER